MNGLELRHYGSIPLVIDREREYRDQRIHHKPQGLWLSVLGEDDWPSWCEQENFAQDSFEYESAVTIRDGANILMIENGLQLMDFHREFKADLIPGSLEYIDWGRVVQKYDGIIIAPYQWHLRLNDEIFWYYSWDCASGCVWNLGVVEVSETKKLIKHGKD